MPDANLALSIENLTARLPSGLGLRKKTILEGIHLRLERGQVLGLLGPNGSGKTTLMRHMAGLLRPSSGRVLTLGLPARDPKALRRVTYLPEDSPFPGELRAPAALALLAHLRGVSGKLARTQQKQALERAGLGHALRTPLARYSRGMLRRFGLAQAFLFEPELVLLDEPTAGLDAPGLLLLEDWLGEHKARGGSLVLCSHALTDLATLTDRVAILWEGHLAAFGATSDHLTNPARRWVEWETGENSDETIESEVERFLADRGAASIRSGNKWKSLFDVYRDVQAESTSSTR